MVAIDFTPLRWAALVYAGFGMLTMPNSKPRLRQSEVAGSYRLDGVLAVAAPCQGLK